VPGRYQRAFNPSTVLPATVLEPVHSAIIPVPQATLAETFLATDDASDGYEDTGDTPVAPNFWGGTGILPVFSQPSLAV
jgi:hypothetical protein